MLLLRWNLFIKLIEPCPQHDRVSNSTDYGNFYVFKDAKVQKAFMIQFIAIYIHISKSWTGKHLFLDFRFMSKNKIHFLRTLFLISMQNQIIWIYFLSSTSKEFTGDTYLVNALIRKIFLWWRTSQFITFIGYKGICQSSLA